MENQILVRLTAASTAGLLSAIVLISADGRIQTPSGKGTGAATLSFRATSDDGQPVLDLKPAEVNLKVGGKPRELRSLQLLQMGSKASPASPASSLPPPFATNVSSGAGRDLFLVVDDESMMRGTEQTMKDAMTQLITALSAQDRVALITVPRSTTNIPLTNQHDGVRAAVTRLMGRAEGTVTDRDFACRTQMTLQSLRAFFGSLSGGASSTVVFYSSGLTAPTGDNAAQVGFSSDTCVIQTKNYQDVVPAVAASRANFYVAHVMESVVNPTVTEESNPLTGARRRNQGIGSPGNLAAGVEGLAGVTGGELIRLSGRSENAMARVARETSAYYVASFEPEASERNGGSAKIELRIVREGVKIKVPPEMMIAKAGGLTPRDLLRVEAPFQDLPLRAVGYSVRNPGDDKLKIIALFEPVEPSVALTSATVGLIDKTSGKLGRQWTADASDLTKSPLMAAMLAPAGTYRMRVAAADASGRTGAVDYELRAEFTSAGPVKLGSLALGAATGGSFTFKLQFGPGDPAALAYLEIYGAPKGAALAVNLELAESDTAQPLGTAETRIQGNADDFKIAIGGFPLDSLRPGDYQIRAIVSANGNEVGRVARTMRKAAQ